MDTPVDADPTGAPIAVCWKWVDLRPEIDPLTGAVSAGDERFGGVGASDRAALEVALQARERWGCEVVVISAGPAPAEVGLREALACGAQRAIRVDLASDAPSESVAAALADALDALVPEVALVICGDYSPDRGSGSVPAFLAARRQVAQALGVVGVEFADRFGPDTPLRVRRRLDGGRREHLALTASAVISVEGSVATLRRAPLSASLSRSRLPVTVTPGPVVDEHPHRPTRAVRPRPRDLAGPAGETALERIRHLTGATTGEGRRRTVLELPPEEAAAVLLAEIARSERDTSNPTAAGTSDADRTATAPSDR